MCGRPCSGFESGRQGRADTLQVRPCKLAVVIRPPWMAEVSEMQEHFSTLTTDGRPNPAGQTLCIKSSMADGFKTRKQQSPARRGLLLKDEWSPVVYANPVLSLDICTWFHSVQPSSGLVVVLVVRQLVGKYLFMSAFSGE